MAEQGRDVILLSNSFTVPHRCCACGAAPQTTLDAKKKKTRGRGWVSRSFQIPYCGPCAARVRATRMKAWVFSGVTFAIAGVFWLLGLVAPGLPFVVLVVLPPLFATIFAIVAMTALAPKPPALPAMGAGDAVKLVDFDGYKSTLHCVNPHWGEEFARANNVQAIPKSRSHFFAAQSLWVALVAAPIGAAGVWFAAHPQVHVDNAGPEALQIWVDGKAKMVVPSNVSGAVPPYMWIPRGKHTFGYSKEGATAPEGTVDANVTMNDAHLYNPEKTACYWLVADSYGAASVAGIARGPQPILEFYSFDKVNTWFGDNPQSVEVDSDSGKKGDTRVALQRAKACMDLAAHGCNEQVRDQFVQCQRAAKDDASFKKCEDTAETCEKPAPGAVKPAAGAHVAAGGHAAPHPGGGHAAPPAASAKSK